MKNIRPAAFLVGFTVGGIIIGRITKPAKKLKKPHSFGNIRIDRSDSSSLPSLFLELTVPIEELSTQETVIFVVVNEDYISHN